ncbi:MAG: hypothetical protein M1827_004323 [Pycnora praestabilis]|nr:MAG: hypothetical protein M1827_004323 [Pycnora praestabilis]
MSENTAPIEPKQAASNADSTRGLPYYEKLRRDLRETLQKKRLLDKNMATLEDSIHRLESSYLEETTAGNIIRGFDNYVKGSTTTNSSSLTSTNPTGGTSRSRKAAVLDTDRVFSRSSASFMRDSPAPSSVTTTPSHAPTPSFSGTASREARDHATPTSATSGGTAMKEKGVKKNKKAAAAAAIADGAAGAEEDDGDGKQAKRLKISFGRE